MSSAGASRRSSVKGLKVNPSSPTRLPSRDPPIISRTRVTKSVRCRWLISSTAASSGEGTPASEADLTVIVTWFGRHEPPNPTPARRKLAADPRVERHPGHHLVDLGAIRVAERGELVGKADLRCQEQVGAAASRMPRRLPASSATGAVLQAYSAFI